MNEKCAMCYYGSSVDPNVVLGASEQGIEIAYPRLTPLRYSGPVCFTESLIYINVVLVDKPRGYRYHKCGYEFIGFYSEPPHIQNI